ncbi:PIN-like domain-containing protein [Planktothrix mougeotii]|uniref:VapC45 PIN like domain-containing protein n=1 Tax=Planktothrix mougeotii LEGE 06226 TaxID=1828728 RepID=A0ABR9U820_9CYAN|nr:DUF5615 family PIN-like protein [Planktothrix mougeotii]MBE9142593.1 hypothetical protein [Planktothrix mougeotii LEGE 06226]
MTYHYTYFIDRALGKSLGDALQSLGVKIEFHHDHFPPDSPDTEWLPIVSQQGWVVLTKDDNISRNILEVEQIAHSQARVFILVSGNLSRQDVINIFVNAIDKIEKITQGNQAPFIAKIYRPAKVSMWLNRVQLRKHI